MSRLHITTRGIANWRERLASPDGQWKRRYSAFETAVSWERAAETPSGLPPPIERLLHDSNYFEPTLAFAVAEHKVSLPGGHAASQNDVWAVVKTSAGMLSLTVEAKAREAFGDDVLEKWLDGSGSATSVANRKIRWEHIRAHLPESSTYLQVRYQLLHRCAAAVIEARRLGFQHAAFVVQAFMTPASSHEEYAVFCQTLGVPAERGQMHMTAMDGMTLSVGWADCPLATDADIVATV